MNQSNQSRLGEARSDAWEEGPLTSAKNPRVNYCGQIHRERTFLILMISYGFFCKQSISFCIKVIRKDPYPFTGIPNLKELPRLDLPFSIHHPTGLSSSRLCALPELLGLAPTAPQALSERVLSLCSERMLLPPNSGSRSSETGQGDLDIYTVQN